MDCIWVSSGKRLPKSCANDSARAPSPAIASHRQGERRFDLDRMACWLHFQAFARSPPRLGRIAERSLTQRCVVQPYCSGFFAVSPHGGIHGSLCEFPCPAQMASIRLGVGCERKSKALVLRLARKPRRLFRHGSGIRAEKSQSIENTVKPEIIQFSHLGLLQNLSRLVEALQGEEEVAEIFVGKYIVGHEPEGLASRLDTLLILTHLRINDAHDGVGRVVAGIAFNLLLQRLSCLVQLPCDTQIVKRGNDQLFPFTGVLAQLECFGEIFICPSDLTQTGVVAAHCEIAHCKIWVELDGTLMVGQGCCGVFLATDLFPKTVRLQSFERGRCGLFEGDIELLHRGEPAHTIQGCYTGTSTCSSKYTSGLASGIRLKCR